MIESFDFISFLPCPLLFFLCPMDSVCLPPRTLCHFSGEPLRTSSRGKRSTRRALTPPPIAPAAPATVAVVPVGAAPVGRQARKRGVGAIVKAGIENTVVVETGTGTGTGIVTGGEAVGAEVEIGSVVTAAAAGIVDTVSHEVETGVVRIVCTTGVHRLPLGVGMDTVRVLISERRARSGSLLII